MGSLTQFHHLGFDRMILNFTSKNKHAKMTADIQRKKSMRRDCLTRHISAVIKTMDPGARMDKSEK